MIEFWEWLPENERLIVDVLRQIIIENLPKDQSGKKNDDNRQGPIQN